MELKCPSCNQLYDRHQHIPHFIPCGCDICSSCVQKYVYRSSGPTTTTTKDDVRSNSSRASSVAPATNNNNNNNQEKTATSNTSSRRPSQVAGSTTTSQTKENIILGPITQSPVVPVIVNQAYKCPRGHITAANTINNCQPMIAHRLAEQVRDINQTCPIHARRPLDFWCVPHRMAMCGVCALSHKEESNCLLPARPIQQCTGEILKLAYEARGQLENSSRNVQNCQVVTSRMLKSASQVPVDLMNTCLHAIEQFHDRILKSVDSVWREHMNELKNVRRSHAALGDIQQIIETYKEKMVQGEKLCDETEASTRVVDPLPLAATMAQIEQDSALKFPLKLYALRGIESVILDPSGATISASWTEPFHGKGEFIPVPSFASSQSAAAAAMLDRAASPGSRNRLGSAARKEVSPLSQQRAGNNKNLPPVGFVNVDGTPMINENSSTTRGHTPLGLFSVTDILNMGPRRLGNDQSPLPPSQQQNSINNYQNIQSSKTSSRSNTPTRQAHNANVHGNNNNNNNARSRFNNTPPGERTSGPGSPYVQIRSFNPIDSSSGSAARRR